MKLKEFPGSVWLAFKLGLIPVAKLHDPDADTMPVVVSITSIPSRFGVIHLTIRSILAGTKKPFKVVLWLNKEFEQKLPNSLLKLRGSRFEIRFVEGNLPHRKLVHSLELFPNYPIITCDDDMMYAPNWVELLYSEHTEFPNCILANECRRINHDAEGGVTPYFHWYKELNKGVSSDPLLPLGFGGVLYPPGALHSDVVKKELYEKLAPRADDLWFKAMAFLQGTKIRRASDVPTPPVPIFNSQWVSLKSSNVKQDGNRKQWEAIKHHYNLPSFAPVFPQKKAKR